MSRILDKLKGIQTTERQKVVLNRAIEAIRSESPNQSGWLSEAKVIVIIFLWALFVGPAGIFASYKIVSHVLFKEEVLVAEIPTAYEFQSKKNKLALQAYRAGDYKAAEQAWSKLAKIYPEIAEFKVNQAMALKSQRKKEKALRLLTTATIAHPKNAVAFNNLGLLASQMGDFLLAQESLEKAIALDPNKVEPLFNLASVFEKQGDYSYAIQYYKKFITHPSAPKNLIAQVKKRLPRLNSVHVESVTSKDRG